MELLLKRDINWKHSNTEQFGKDSDQVLLQQSWIVFDDLSSVIFVEVESQNLGRCQNLTIICENYVKSIFLLTKLCTVKVVFTKYFSGEE